MDYFFMCVRVYDTLYTCFHWSLLKGANLNSSWVRIGFRWTYCQIGKRAAQCHVLSYRRRRYAFAVHNGMVEIQQRQQCSWAFCSGFQLSGIRQAHRRCLGSQHYPHITVVTYSSYAQQFTSSAEAFFVVCYLWSIQSRWTIYKWE